VRPVRTIPIACALFAAAHGAEQVKLDRVERMPNLPQPYAMRDWKKVARGKATVQLDPDSAPIVVLVPANAGMTREGRRAMVNGVVVDYCCP